MSENSRLGFAGIIIENREACADKVNDVLSDFGEIIVARVGIPYNKKKCCVITLVVDTTISRLGALTGRLGAISGVSVRSALAKEEK